MNKKIRNRLLALGCVGVFVALGVALYNNWVVQKPFAVILFIADGLTTGSLTAARIYDGGANHRLNVEKFPHLAVLTTYANDYAVPDAASGATALATGRKVNARALAKAADGRPLTTLLEAARERGRSVGIVSNASLTDATGAAFYAKTSDALDFSTIGQQMADNEVADVLLGGGEADLLPEHKEGRRQDGRDLLLEMRERGYDVIRTRGELENTPSWRAPKVVGVFAKNNLAFVDEIEASASQPSLAEMVRRAIEFLQFNPKGYFLVVDAGLITKAAHQNEGERMLRELIELDRAVGVALEYAGENALVVVTGKQSVGGLRMNGNPFLSDKGLAVVGVNAQGLPSLSWSTGPGGFREKSPTDADSTGLQPDPAASHSPTALGVAEDVLAVSTGPGSEKLQGFQDNTDVFRVLRENL